MSVRKLNTDNFCTGNFRVFNFRIFEGIRKYFYTENFQIYGMLGFSSFVFSMRNVTTISCCIMRPSDILRAFRDNDRPNCSLLGKNGRAMYCREHKSCCFVFVARSLSVCLLLRCIRVR